MKTMTTSSLFRLAALLIIALIVVCMVGFAAEDLKGDKNPQPESPDTSEGDDEAEEESSAPTPPAYTHYLTGLEVLAEEQNTKPLCFVMDTASPLYGICGTSLTIEIPLENGKSRFLLYQDNFRSLGKIGSITATRDCIQSLLGTFGGISIYNGNDGMHATSGSDGGKSSFDLSASVGYAYTENTSFLYSNGDLMLAGLQNAGVSTATATPESPFQFAPFFSDPIHFSTSATSVIIPYADGNETSLFYDAETRTYTLGKGGQVKYDLLNGKSTTYTNAFVLFADTTTYESANQTEMVTDTASGGEGYYFTEGTAAKIRWSTDPTGKLILKNDKGEILTVNRGTSYIAFYKASCSSSIIFS